MDISCYQKEMQKLHRKMHHHRSHILRMDFDHYHITDHQFEVLSQIHMQDGLAIKELANNLQQDAGNMSSLCKRLEKANFITRSRSLQDERVVHLHLSSYGQQCVDEINQKAKVHFEQQWEAYNDQDKEFIIHSLIELNQFLSNIWKKEEQS